MSNKIRQLQEQINTLSETQIAVDGSWGPISQSALDTLITCHNSRIYFDFDMFKKLFELPKIDQDMVDNLNYLFDEFNSLTTAESTNPLYIAYMLATTWHETGFTFKPIKEYGSDAYLSKYDTGKLAKILGNTPEADGDGQLYAGRGYVQITGKSNYHKFSSIVGHDLVSEPNKALWPRVAARILVEGSIRGLFTGRGLKHFIRRGTVNEFIEARRVINGTDKANSIATYAVKFLSCLVIERLS